MCSFLTTVSNEHCLCNRSMNRKANQSVNVVTNEEVLHADFKMM